MAGELYALSSSLVDYIATNPDVQTMVKGAEDKQVCYDSMRQIISLINTAHLFRLLSGCECIPEPARSVGGANDAGCTITLERAPSILMVSYSLLKSQRFVMRQHTDSPLQKSIYYRRQHLLPIPLSHTLLFPSLERDTLPLP